MELLFAAILVGTVVSIRVGVYLLPDKNLMIYGLEAHHYLTGVAICLLALLISPSGSTVQVVMLGIGCGLFVDEIGFILVGGTDDISYWRALPTAISFLGLTAAVVFLLF